MNMIQKEVARSTISNCPLLTESQVAKIKHRDLYSKIQIITYEEQDQEGKKTPLLEKVKIEAAAN